jgi:L-cysteine/cystine lyase
VSWVSVRAAYPVLERTAYLNAGTFGPLARATVDALAAASRDDLERGRSGRDYFESLLAARERVRALFAAEIGVEPEQVALTRSTTDGCNIVLAGLDLGPSDEVVTTDSEHFGLLGALAVSPARVRVARVRDLPPERVLEAILAEVGPRTRLVALQHVSWITGARMPVEELRKAVDVPMLVDGAQAVGAIRVDAAGLDLYAFSGQKWLCCPDGTGALYVRDPERLAVRFPTYFSQIAYEPDGAFVPRPGAARFDDGWLAPGVLAGIEAALGVHAEAEGRFERARELADRCREALLAVGEDVVTEPGQGTLVSWRCRGEPAELVARLEDARVIVRFLPGTGLVRASCGYWTSEDDIARLVEALAVDRA